MQGLAHKLVFSTHTKCTQCIYIVAWYVMAALEEIILSNGFALDTYLERREMSPGPCAHADKMEFQPLILFFFFTFWVKDIVG